jgi:hypothetical protein
MDHSLYTSKKNIKLPGFQAALLPEIILDDFLDRQITEGEFLLALCNSFKDILDKKTVRSIIESIFKLEGTLYKLKAKYPENSIIEDLADFYKSLSPMLLRVMWEQTAVGRTSTNLLDGLVSSLHVALEEELFYWQDRLKSVDN